MYKEHFGLRESPFSIAPDPRFLYMSEGHREALAHLMYGLQGDGGFVLLTGEVGAGKTTVCRCFLEQAPPGVNTAFILNPKLTSSELLASICDELGIGYPVGTTSVKVLVDSIHDYLLKAQAVGEKTVLIIEEAQNLLPDVLEQIRLLTNLETSTRKLLQVILLGQPELRDMLSRPEMSQLSQRITARYHLGPLTKKEAAAYVEHRLAVAGTSRRLFASHSGSLYRRTGGIPRIINLICDRALLGAYVQGRDRVGRATLVRASSEVLGQRGLVRPGRIRVPRLLALVSSALIIAAALLAFSFRGPFGGGKTLSSDAVSLKPPGSQKLDTLWWFGYGLPWRNSGDAVEKASLLFHDDLGSRGPFSIKQGLKGDASVKADIRKETEEIVEGR